jgi:hypothetical protein
MSNSDETPGTTPQENPVSIAPPALNFAFGAKMGQRTNLAIHHLLGATEAARRAHKIDEDNKRSELGGWFDSLIHDVSVVIILSSAALEAHVNELLTDIIDADQPGITSQRKELLKLLRDDFKNSMEDKYIQLALYYDKSVDKGCIAWQDMKLLSQLRNALVHFRPAWDDDKIHRGEMVQTAKKRFAVSRFYDPNAMFPYVCFTYDCARWSVKTAQVFTSYYCSILGMQDRFGEPRWNFTLP